jgi:hypothetical protein
LESFIPRKLGSGLSGTRISWLQQVIGSNDIPLCVRV